MTRGCSQSPNTRPWTATTDARFPADAELFEFICDENEKSTPHMGQNIKSGGQHRRPAAPEGLASTS
jgi:hypothetical protein